MTRPRKRRRVCFYPSCVCFKPQGVPKRLLGEAVLTIDELEAIRLADLENLGQVRAAQEMAISQSTFARLLSSAHHKVSTALVRGKMIKIEGGDYTVSKTPVRQFRCEECGHVFEVPFGTGKMGVEINCPECSSEAVYRIDRGGYGYARRLWGFRSDGT